MSGCGNTRATHEAREAACANVTRRGLPGSGGRPRGQNADLPALQLAQLVPGLPGRVVHGFAHATFVPDAAWPLLSTGKWQT
jgi:hypothetical protein